MISIGSPGMAAAGSAATTTSSLQGKYHEKSNPYKNGYLISYSQEKHKD